MSPRNTLPSDRPGPRVVLDDAPSGLDLSGEGAICFAAMGAPPGDTRLSEIAQGGVEMSLVLAGRVMSVGEDALRLDSSGAEVEVRFLLPRAVRLGGLVGHRVRIELRHAFLNDMPPTADGRIYDSGDRLLLWARDGALPARPPLPVSVRATHDAGAPPRLVLAGSAGVLGTATRGTLDLGLSGDGYRLRIVRLAPRVASFVVVRTAG